MRWLSRFAWVLVMGSLAGCATTHAPQKQALSDAKTSFIAKDYVAARQKLTPLAIQGDAEAQYTLGYLYFYGLGGPADRDTALAWIRASAEHGNKRALAALASADMTRR